MVNSPKFLRAIQKIVFVEWNNIGCLCCSGEVAQGMVRGDEFRMSAERFGPEVRTRAGRMPSRPALRNVLSHFITVMMSTTMNEMGFNLTEVSMG